MAQNFSRHMFVFPCSAKPHPVSLSLRFLFYYFLVESGVAHSGSPTKYFAIFEPRNPGIGLSELHTDRQSCSKIVKGSVGEEEMRKDKEDGELKKKLSKLTRSVVCVLLGRTTLGKQEREESEKIERQRGNYFVACSFRFLCLSFYSMALNKRSGKSDRKMRVKSSLKPSFY